MESLCLVCLHKLVWRWAWPNAPWVLVGGAAATAARQLNVRGCAIVTSQPGALLCLAKFKGRTSVKPLRPTNQPWPCWKSFGKRQALRPRPQVSKRRSLVYLRAFQPTSLRERLGVTRSLMAAPTKLSGHSRCWTTCDMVANSWFRPRIGFAKKFFWYFLINIFKSLSKSFKERCLCLLQALNALQGLASDCRPTAPALAPAVHGRGCLGQWHRMSDL